MSDSASFWEAFGSSNELLVGLDVLWSETGFKTFVKWYQRSEVLGVQLLLLAKTASKHFDTEVALGGFLQPSDGSMDQFLVVTPESELYRAYSTENSDVFEVESYGQPANILDVLSIIETGKEQE